MYKFMNDRGGMWKVENGRLQMLNPENEASPMSVNRSVRWLSIPVVGQEARCVLPGGRLEFNLGTVTEIFV